MSVPRCRPSPSTVTWLLILVFSDDAPLRPPVVFADFPSEESCWKGTTAALSLLRTHRNVVSVCTSVEQARVLYPAVWFP